MRKDLQEWRERWRRIMPGATDEEVGRRARQSARQPPATEELGDLLRGLKPEHRDYIFGNLKSARWSGPEAALRAARSVSRVVLRPEPMRGELVASILKDHSEGPTERQRRPPGKASPAPGVPPPSYWYKKRLAEMAPEERRKARAYAPRISDEKWARQIKAGLMGLGAVPGVGFTSPVSRAWISGLERLRESLQPLEPIMTKAQAAEWKAMLEAGQRALPKLKPWQRIPRVTPEEWGTLAALRPTFQTLREALPKVREKWEPDYQRLLAWWRYWRESQRRGTGGGGAG